MPYHGILLLHNDDYDHHNKNYIYIYEKQYNPTVLLQLFLSLNDLGQLGDHYCHWFLELSFSRISESTTGYTFTPCVRFFTSSGIDST